MSFLTRTPNSPYNVKSKSDGYASVELACATTYVRARNQGRITEKDINHVKSVLGVASEEALFDPTSIDLLKAVIIKLVVNDFYSFALLLDLPVDSNEIYKEIIDTLYTDADDIPMTALFIPRGHLKTTLLMAYGVWLYIKSTYLYNVAPRILLVHNSEAKNQENLKLVQEFTRLPQLQGLFFKNLRVLRSNLYMLDFAAASAVKRKEPNFSITTVGSPQEGKHYGVVLADDVVSQNSDTEKGAQAVIDWMNTLIPLDDSARPGGIRINVVGTEYSKISFYQRIVRKTYKFLSYPLEKEPGVSNFPERTDSIAIERLKSTYSQSMAYYESQYNMIPYDIGEETIAFGTKNLPEYKERKDDIVYTVLTFDPAIATKRGSSTAVLLLVNIHRDGRISVDDGWGDTINKSPTLLINRCVTFIKQYGVNEIIIEQIAYQKVLLIQLQEALTKESLTFVKVTGHMHHTTKEEHIAMSLQGYFEAGRILINPRLRHLIDAVNQNIINDWIDSLSFISEIRGILLSYSFYPTKDSVEGARLQNRQRLMERYEADKNKNGVRLNRPNQRTLKEVRKGYFNF